MVQEIGAEHGELHSGKILKMFIAAIVSMTLDERDVLITQSFSQTSFYWNKIPLQVR